MQYVKFTITITVAILIAGSTAKVIVVPYTYSYSYSSSNAVYSRPLAIRYASINKNSFLAVLLL